MPLGGPYCVIERCMDSRGGGGGDGRISKSLMPYVVALWMCFADKYCPFISLLQHRRLLGIIWPFYQTMILLYRLRAIYFESAFAEPFGSRSI
jgi:hypothetical protein